MSENEATSTGQHLRWRVCEAKFLELRDELRAKRSGQPGRFTQEALAKAVGCSRTYLSPILKGKRRISDGTVRSLQRALEALGGRVIRREELLEPDVQVETVQPKFKESLGIEGKLVDFAKALTGAFDGKTTKRSSSESTDQTKHHPDSVSRTLYCSLTDGHWLWEHIPKDDDHAYGRFATRARLNRIVVRIMRPLVMRTLEQPRCRILSREWMTDLSRSLSKLGKLDRIDIHSATGSESLHPISLQIEYWPCLAPIWGFLLEDLLIYGKWHVNSRGHYEDRSTCWLVHRTGPTAAEFEHYSRLLIRGHPVIASQQSPLLEVQTRPTDSHLLRPPFSNIGASRRPNQ